MKSLRGKTVLVTGATGFIGGHLLERLRKEECFKLVALSRRPISAPDKSITWICSSLDALCPDIWPQAGVKEIDIVFHLISTTLPESSNDDPVFDVQSNVVETLFLFEIEQTKN